MEESARALDGSLSLRTKSQITESPDHRVSSAYASRCREATQETTIKAWRDRASRLTHRLMRTAWPWRSQALFSLGLMGGLSLFFGGGFIVPSIVLLPTLVGVGISLASISVSALMICAAIYGRSFASHFAKRRLSKDIDSVTKDADQLLIVLQELQKLTGRTNDWGTDQGHYITDDKDLDNLYQCWIDAGLPMNDTMREIFKYEIAEDEKKNREHKENEEIRELKETVYSDEQKKIDELLDQHKSANTTDSTKTPVSHVTGDGSQLDYDGEDPRMVKIINRVNEISREMDDAKDDSSKTFIAEMKIPVESLSRLAEAVKASGGNRDVDEIFRRSLKLLDDRLDREEVKIIEVQKSQANQEHHALEGLLS